MFDDTDGGDSGSAEHGGADDPYDEHDEFDYDNPGIREAIGNVAR